MTSKEIRETFLQFFESKGHTIVPSAPMVIKDDPTLMFTNAGMNQFKDWFLGNSPIKHKRVADSQKCLRVSGKHNDLEEVGHDTYHHTMFEMLGNWSFGDYFKSEAIAWAWELLVDIYKLDKERLYATIFEGNAQDNLLADEQAKEEWLKYLPASRILNGNKKDNFWEMGDTGPCGPCSEVHIDLRSDKEREEVDGALLVNKDHPLVIEIWNLVFIQFNRKADGSLVALPSKHVDTGMGFERLCMALQGKQSNYDTDVFTGLLNKISDLTGKKQQDSPQIGVAMRVIADHIRAISFSIADGQLPSNVKAGYVIRRILRRAVRYAYTFLECNEPLLYKLVGQLVNEMGDAYPELVSQQSLIEKVIKEEEESFLRTLEKGIKMLETIIAKSKNKLISGHDAFVLYDTYGFPIDLSELIARENGFSIDHDAFLIELDRQKERSRQATSVVGGDWVELAPYNGTNFTGYHSLEEECKIVRYRSVTVKNKELFHIVLDKSPFYAEGGGQVGDSGVLEESGIAIPIINTIRENNLQIHISTTLPTSPSATFVAKVDSSKREATAANHTATHLLHKALRDKLGVHVEQKGSLVTPEYLRFDFSHFEKISEGDLREIEREVNSYIRMNLSQETLDSLTMEEAKKRGAIALFGEKYGESVRVIKFGDSLELCGGTHASSTGKIGLFKIRSESAIAAGVRRIEAVSGLEALQLVEQTEELIKSIKERLNNSPNIITALEKLIAENESLTKKVEDSIKEQAKRLKEQIANHSQSINGIKLYLLKGEYSSEVVKNLAFLIKGEGESSVAFAAAYTDQNKPSLALLYSEDLIAHGKNASKEIREAAKLINGGGGGQPFFATAGGKESSGLEAAMDKLIELAIS